MKLKINYTVAALLFLIADNGFSQAIRFNIYNFCDDFRINESSDIYNEGGSSLDDNSDFYCGIGYEQNIGDRISISAEINSSMGKIYSESYVSVPESYVNQTSGQTFIGLKDYSLYVSYVELKYISKYFFRENDDRCGYIASTLGFKKVNYGYADQQENQGDLSLKESKLIFPLGLRLGWRGSIDGWFGDGFVGAGLNIRAGAESKDPVIKVFNKNSTISKIYFTAGYSFGIGWAD